MAKKFLDTNVLLKGNFEELSKHKFVISSITLVELENIKNDSRKDFEVKTKARRVSRWLADNEKKYDVSIYNENLIAPLKDLGLEINNDAKIIASALDWSKSEKVTLVTGDLNMYHIAKTLLPKVELYEPEKDTYCGMKKVYVDTEEIGYIYNNREDNKYGLLTNEYMQMFTKEGEWVSLFKWNGNELVDVQFPQFRSRWFGTVKPMDYSQRAAMDSLLSNQVTVLRGPAGSGKSYLTVSFLFSLLEKGEIDKIVVFVNTPAAKGATKLGFYPGSKDEKLLSSTVGNILASKLGSIEEVENKIVEGRLELLPVADLRGYDTSGMRVGIWIVEAQNMSRYLMQLALQRIDDNSRLIIDGDNNTQVDMEEFAGENNGMQAVSKVFRGQDYYGEVLLEVIHRGKVADRAQLIEI